MTSASRTDGILFERWVNQTRETSIRLQDSKVIAISDAEIARQSMRLYEEGTIRVRGEMVSPMSLEDWEHELFNMPLEIPEGFYSICPMVHGRPEGLDRGPLVRRVCDSTYDNARDNARDNAYASGTHASGIHGSWQLHMLELAELLRQRFPQVRFSHKLGLVSSLTGYVNTAGRKLLHTSVQENHELLWHLPGSEKLFDGCYEVREAVVDARLRFEHISALVEAGLNTLETKAYISEVDALEQANLFGNRVRVAFHSDEYEFQKTLMTDLHGSVVAKGLNRLREGFHKDLELRYMRGEGHMPCFFDETGGVCDGGVRLVGDGRLTDHYSDYVTQLESRAPYVEMAATWAAYDGIPGRGYHPIIIQMGSVKDEGDYDSLWKGDVLWLHDFGGSKVDASGLWTAPVQNAFLMRDGRPVAQMGGFMVSGVMGDILGVDFRGISAPFSKGSTRSLLHCAMKMTRP